MQYDDNPDYPGMTIIQGGDEDSFNYDIGNDEADGYSFSLKYLVREIKEENT